MCYVHLQKDQLNGAQLLTVDSWQHIMAQSIDHGMMYATLTGGECLTYPGFKDLYLYLRNRGIEVTVLSNGLLMDADMVEFFKAHPPASIRITLYGASEDAYERVTGHQAYAKVLNHIRRLKDAQLPLTISVTPNAFMTDGEDIIRLLHAEKFTFAINLGLMAPREATGRKVRDASLDDYIALVKLRMTLNGRAIDPDCIPDILPDAGSENSTATHGLRCGAGRSSFAVDWQGNMRPCNTFPCTPVSVIDLGFDAAWQQTNHTALHYPLPAECKGCAYETICKHCVAEHAAHAPVGHASPFICAWGKRMVSEGLLTLSQPE